MIAVCVIGASLLIAALIGWVTHDRIWPRLNALSTEKAGVAVELLQFWATAVGALALSLTLGVSVFSFTADNRQKDRQRQLELDKAAEAQFSEAIRLLEQPSVVSYHGALVIISSLVERQPERFAIPSRAVVRTAIRDLERRLIVQDGSDEALRLRLDQLLKGYAELHPDARLPKAEDDTKLASARPRVDLHLLGIPLVGDSSLLDGASLSGWSVDFRSTFLPKAAFGGVRMASSNFNRANMPNAVFFKAELARSSFRGAELPGANFGGADLRYVDFEGATLSGATLIGARMDCAELVGTDLSGTRLDIATMARARYYVNTIFPADIDRTAVDRWRAEHPIECLPSRKDP